MARILVIDDEPESVELLVLLLTLDGHDAEGARDGLDALGRLDARQYDLLISDIQMPRLDGAGLYHALERWHPELLHRLIFLSGVSPQGSETFLDGTGVPLVHKPCRIPDLLQIVRSTLRQSRAAGL
jgi:CheY-like chemotaxis protein